tara:strand:+ start:347 stop:598 length:252 start_codon:yes stop_codon:yes gene_type:complete
MNPVCVTCSVEMRCEKNQHGVELDCGFGSKRFFSGDRYGCKNCGQQVVVSFGQPIDSDQDNYEALTEIARFSANAFTVIGEKT